MSKIISVEAHWLRIPLIRNFKGSVYGVPDKNTIYTRITTDDGLVGECMNGEGQSEIHRQTHLIVMKELAPQLIGEDPSQIERLWAKLWGVTKFLAFDKRAAVRAVGCLDSALWDLKGKAANMPLYLLWGGARDRLPIIAIGGQYRDELALTDYGQEIEEFQALGLAGCKFKVGGMSPEDDTIRTQAARAAAGKDFILCVDANRGWSRNDARRYSSMVQDLNIRWFEEPCFWNNDRLDMKLLRHTSGLPIAAGQSEITAEACRDLITDGAVDVCNLDASWGGGPTAWLRVAKVAACFGIQMAHHGEPILGSQLLAAVDNGTYAETHHPDRDPLFHGGVEGRGAIIDGIYHLPPGPGFGVHYDPQFVAKHRVAV